ncbi:MAG: 16S rRNA (adenine(1518)-N(6)/adenine(1519)-N(6))-dimethyltransferase RsmA [Patescibacteria group bacterium]
MADLTDKKQLIRFLQQHGLYTKKKLGQNFLVDRAALDKIVDAAGLLKDDCVIEIGPGLGVLTEELVKRAGKVVAVELDAALAEILEVRFSKLEENQKPLKSKIDILKSDILRINLSETTKDCSSYKVVANIPYYITSKILRFFLEAEKKPELIVLLTQKEVAERIVAKPGEMSILSVSVQYYGRPEIIDIVPETSFFPMPEVDSAILKISNIHTPSNSPLLRGRNLNNSSFLKIGNIPSDSSPKIGEVRWGMENTDVKEFFRCIHIGFSSRRKTLLNNLSAGYHLDKKTTLDILEKVGLTERTRAQELSIGKWQELCRQLPDWDRKDNERSGS